MIAAIPVLIFVFPSDCGVNSGKKPDQEKASFPLVEILKIPAVLMIGEYIDNLFLMVIQENFSLLIAIHNLTRRS